MRVLITQPIEQDAMRELRRRHVVQSAIGLKRHELTPYLQTCEVLVCRSSLCADADLLCAAPHLQLVVRVGLGCENVDRAAARARNIKLLHVPTPRATAMLRAIDRFCADRATGVRAIALHAGLDRAGGLEPELALESVCGNGSATAAQPGVAHLQWPVDDRQETIQP